MRARFAGVLALLLLSFPSTALPGPSDGHPLEGAWRLVGTLAENDDAIEPLRPGFEQYKLVIGNHFMWTSMQDGRVLRSAGGPCRMGRATYVERVDYASDPDYGWMVGHRHTFRWRIENGRWHHVGTLRGNGGHTARVAEVWERAD